MQNIGAIRINVHVYVDEKPCAFWKLKVLGRLAALLGIKLRLEAQ